MTAVEGPKSAGLLARAQNILMKPSAEWDVIEAEPATVQGLYLGYVCILAVLPVIGALLARILLAGVVGSMFGGAAGGAVGMSAALVSGIADGLIGYVLNLAVVYVVGLIINALASSFDAKPEPIHALKVAVYSGTALWVAGLFIWVPLIGFLLYLGALGYTCYLLYLGVARVMKPPADKAMVYTLVVIGSEILLVLVAWWITGMIVGMMFLGAMAGAHY